ncbi:hypothetical protein H5410_008935, partial [Solanum commersonii]
MDPTINMVASSEMIPTPSVAASPSASVANVITHGTQFQAASQNLPPDARQKGPMPPLFPTSSELNQGDHFTTFEQTQNTSLLHSTQDTPLVYTFAPPKAPTVTHHAPPVYTFVTTPPISKAQEFHRQD